MSDMAYLHHQEGPHREPGTESNRFSNPEYKPLVGSFDAVAEQLTIQIDQALKSNDPNQLQEIETNRQLLDTALGLITVLFCDPTSSLENQSTQTLTKAIASRESQIEENNLLSQLGEGDDSITPTLQQEISAIKFLYRFSHTGSISQALVSKR